MISKSAFSSLTSNKFNYLSDISLYLKQKLNKIIFKIILNYINKTNRFNFFNSLKSFPNYNSLFSRINIYKQDLINIKTNNYFNMFFNSNKNLKEDFKIFKKNKLLFINYLSFTPSYLKNSIIYPKLDNLLFKKSLDIINKTNFNDKILNEIRVRNNINLLLIYNLSLNSYYDFFSIEIYNIIILSNYLSNKDNLKTTSIYHLLFSLINNGILLDDNMLSLKNESDLNIIKKLIKNEKAKAKNFVNPSFFNLFIIHFIKLYFDIKSLLIRNKYLARKTFISKKIKILFQYMIKLNISLFKDIYLIPDYFLFILLNIKNLKISKIFLNTLNNSAKRNMLNFNSLIYNKSFKNNNQKLVDIKQQYYLFLLKRASSDYELKMLLNSVYINQIINYFRFLILTNTIKIFKKENIYQNFLEDILIINNYRY